jgi:hippurate hydrolase
MEEATMLASVLFAASLAAADVDWSSLGPFYRDLHEHPELSFQEKATAAKLAERLRALGFDVTEGVGKTGVVGVLKNGAGPTVMLRTELDALPVEEKTGLPFASAATAKNSAGETVHVMHACGHDLHMTTWVGAAAWLAGNRARWHGTLVMVGQPAEEVGGGAKAMLDDGLFTRFPRPDAAFAVHDQDQLSAGTIGIRKGPLLAGTDSVDITVYGRGGHGARPHMTVDPIVIAAKFIVGIQTLVSRENDPFDPAVVTVGSIHGGTKHNIIPDEVKLQLTIRSYADEVRNRLLEAVRRICRGEAIAAGLPEERFPIVTVSESEFTPATYNDPTLTRRVRESFVAWLGADHVKSIDPEMGGEDFGRFGRTVEKVPVCLFRVGAVAPEAVAASQRTGTPLPSLHSSKFAPVPEPTIKTGITALTAAALELLGRR